MSGIISIQPFGDIKLVIIRSLEDVLLTAFDCNIEVLSPLDMPLYAFSARRDQFSAPTILKRMSRISIGKGSKLLAVTNDDVYVRGRNFIFGQAQVNGLCSIISLYRLRTSDLLALLERVRKEAVHEMGHTFGLPHCDRHDCVMRFSENVQEVDAKPVTFCDGHRMLLAKIMGEIEVGK